MKNSARILSVFLAIAMVASLLAVISLSSFAEDKTFKQYSGELVEGDYIFTAAKDDTVYAMTTKITSKRLTYQKIETSNGSIVNPVESMVWHIAPSGDSWTICSASEGTYAAGVGKANQSGLNENPADSLSLWTVSESEGVYYFVNNGNKEAGVNNLLQFNFTDIAAYPYVATYSDSFSNSTGALITLYKLSDGNEPACEHTYDEGKVTTPASCTENGVKTFTCTKCNDTKTEVIVAQGHKYVNGVCTACKATVYTKTEVADLKEDGKYIVLIGGYAISTEPGSKGFKGIEVAGGDTIAPNEAFLTLTFKSGEDEVFYIVSEDGKYLTSGETGNSIVLQEEKNEYSEWKFVTVDGTLIISNVNAAYTGSNGVTKKQALEYYNGQIYTYGYLDTYTNMGAYAATFYAVNEGSEPPVTADSSVWFALVAVVAVFGIAVATKKVHA